MKYATITLALLLAGCTSDTERAEAVAQFAKACPGQVTAKAYMNSWSGGVEITCVYDQEDGAMLE